MDKFKPGQRVKKQVQGGFWHGRYVSSSGDYTHRDDPSSSKMHQYGDCAVVWDGGHENGTYEWEADLQPG